MNLKQFLARLSNSEVSELSKLNWYRYHIELKVPNQDDAMIYIDLGIKLDLKKKNIGFG